MKGNLVRIHTIAKGINQLYSAMDKGFAKVESNIDLLKKFRNICFEANINLENSLKGFSMTIHPLITRDNPFMLPPEKVFRRNICLDLTEIRNSVFENNEIINSYIRQNADQLEKSYSLDALEKFLSLLEKEFQMLEQNINSLRMMFVLEDRKEQIFDSERILETRKED